MIKPPLMDDQILPEATTVLKALADPNRLRIFNILMEGDSCNGELNERLGLPPNLLSHHLRVLRQAGLVRSRHDALDARWIYYTVDREAAHRWQTWLNELLNPARIQERLCLCGPEGQQQALETPPLKAVL
ncbi:MAG: metalloregulator ArsR/SmtB family transcription factor [Anaerolineae bacterium]|nr:metalloregulator ArsR/SmtB family transcription factor [Anaerolineae bacterium]